MSKIIFYVSLRSSITVDLSNPEKGNPGIGATQYLMVLIATKLKQKFKKLDITIITDSEVIFPRNLNVVSVNDKFEAVKKAKSLSADILIIRTDTDKQLYNYIDDVQQKVITWSHNRFWSDTADNIANCHHVVRNVCVGERQALELIDHKLWEKTIVIKNPQIIDYNFQRNYYKPIVTYIGHLEKARGFHVLARVWKSVLKEVPEAQLYVIGSAKLYGDKIELGKLGVATKKYEQIFLKDITDENGDLLPSVHFQGILGQEKSEIYKNTAVGVINPYGYETLGISGLEMSSCGIPVVTINKYGQSEIVEHNLTGYLFNNINEFKKYLVRLLKNQELNEKFGQNAKVFIEKKYNIDSILNQWNIEFMRINQNIEKNESYYESVEFTLLEKIRVFNFRLKKNTLFSKIPSVLSMQTFGRKILKNTFNKS